MVVVVAVVVAFDMVGSICEDDADDLVDVALFSDDDAANNDRLSVLVVAPPNPRKYRMERVTVVTGVEVSGLGG